MVTSFLRKKKDNMKKYPNDFAKYLTYFLAQYLPGQRNASPNTVASYRDTFKLLLTFFEETKNLRAECIRMETITKDSVIEFLEWLERARNCSIATRNQRLSALHAFLRIVQKESPDNLFEVQKILALPVKKKPKPAISFLSADEMKILLEQPDRNCESGKRDLVLMAVLYDTAARVQELIDLTRRDIRLDKPAVITLHGKGQKTRQVPIMENTRHILAEYLNRYNAPAGFTQQDAPVFYNQQKRKLTRRGIAYIINKHIEMARHNSKLHNNGTITPHVFRHSRAMHMLQAGINLVYIRDFLGHANVTSTEVYARADNETKRKALESAYLEMNTGKMPSWENDGELMNWLQNLCR
jgi:site-specific recombinase XerD